MHKRERKRNIIITGYENKGKEKTNVTRKYTSVSVVTCMADIVKDGRKRERKQMIHIRSNTSLFRLLILEQGREGKQRLWSRMHSFVAGSRARLSKIGPNVM